MQIVPSKTDRERVLLISPGLAHVFALIKRRISNVDGKVPLAVRYDEAERVYSPSFLTSFSYEAEVNAE